VISKKHVQLLRPIGNLEDRLLSIWGADVLDSLVILELEDRLSLSLYKNIRNTIKYKLWDELRDQ
jgi:hypothetical protein